ncbi:MAG: CDP-alcohol phosphatidyltransferase family protein [Chloroflexota bacterium]
MSAANALTLFRAIAGIPIAIALTFDARGLAFAIFLVAALSDALDGWLARRSGTATDRGVLLDPLADKALVLLTLAALWLVGTVPTALVAVITAREMLVAALRVLRYRTGEHSLASTAAKLKTGLEMCAISVLILAPTVMRPVGVALLGAALVISLVTLPTYFPRRSARYTI